MNSPNHRRSTRAVLASIAGVALVSSMWTPASAVEGNTQDDPTAQGLAQVTPDLKVSSDLKNKQGPVSVFVQFTGKGAFEQTQPREVREGLAAPLNKAPEVQQIRSAIESQAAEVAAQASSNIIYTTTNTVPGVAINGDADAIRALASRGDVAKITGIVPKTYDNKGGDIDVRALDSWVERDQTGEGVTIAVLDTGLDYTHSNFGGPGTLEAFAEAQAMDEMPAADSGLWDPEKFAGGWDLVGDEYNADPSNPELYSPIPKPDANPLDCQSHGSHVAGTAAGYGTNADGSTFDGDYGSLTAEDVTKMGIGPGTAPEAKIVALRVFGCDGSSEVVGQALDYVLDPNGDGDFSDRAQVVNMSLGSSFPAYDDPENDIVNALTAQGILSVVSSGNSGDIYDIGGSPGSAETALTVANSVGSLTTLDGGEIVAPEAGVAAGQYTASFNYATAAPEALAGTVVMGPDGRNADGCEAMEPAGDNAGKWVWLSWNENGAERRCGSGMRWNHAADAGYGGVVIDSTLNSFEAGIAGNAAIPGMQFTADTSEALRPAAEAGTLEIRLAPELVGSVTSPSGALDTLNSSSSRGVHGSNGVVKPDVAAPGTQIKSAQVGTGTGASIKSGTSMAAPNVAGIAALVVAQTDYNPYEVKSIIMNTATHDLLTGDGVAYAPNRVGSGRVDALDALNTKVFAYATDQPGLTSVNFGVLEIGGPTELSRSVTIENKGDSPKTYTAEYLAATTVPGVSITVDEGPVTVPANGKATVNVNFSVTDPTALAKTIDPAAEKQQLGADRQYIAEASGRLQLTSEDSVLRVPVYSAPKPVSDIKADSKITFANASELGAVATLSGRALNQGEGSEAYRSLTTPLVLGAESPRRESLALDSLYSLDLRTVGASSTAPALAAAGKDPASGYLTIGLSTWQNWATLNSNSQIRIDLDLNADGQAELAALSTRADGLDQTVFELVVIENGEIVGSLEEMGLANGQFGDVDTNAFDTNVVTLPIPLSALGLDLSAPAPIQYRVSTVNVMSVDESGTLVPVDSTDWIGFDAAQPAMWFNGAPGSEGTGTFLAEDQATLGVNRQEGVNGGKALFLHHHNADGVKDQVTPVEVGALRFADAAGTKFEKEINWMADRGLTTGYSDGTYRPYGSINRDAMAAFLYRLAGSPSYNAPVTSPFADVAPTDQFYKEISWLAESGISTGYSDGTFRPVTPVKRDAMAAFMHRFAGERCSVEGADRFEAPESASFTDVATNNEFHKEISWMKDSGVSTGWPDSTFRPLENVSREAMAAFINRLDTYTTDNGGTCK
ncbi:S8 family serine peptidase [Arthrobacter sp. NPDC055585]